MRKIIFAVICLVMIVGCAQEDTSTSTESPYSGGSKGIIAEFLDMGIYNDNTGIEEIFENETFPIEVMLNNKGEEDVEAGMVNITLKGIALTDFSGIVGGGVLSNTEIIEKVSDNNKVGGEITLDFSSEEEDATYLLHLTGTHYDVTVFGEVVYRYKTHAAVPKVCFKEDPQEDSVCEIEEVKEVYSSGAPIQVLSAMEKRAGTGKVAVEFEIENVGSGDVTKPGEAFTVRYDQLSFTPGDSELWECKAAGRLNEGRLDTEGKITVVCKLKNAMAENTLFTKELSLTLEYDYRELIQREIRVREQ